MSTFDPYMDEVLNYSERKSESFYGADMPSETRFLAFPFVTKDPEISQTGQSFLNKAVQTVENVISYPYEFLKKQFTKTEQPTGIISTSFNLSDIVNTFLKPPMIYIILGVFGIWVYSSFRKR